MKPIKPEMLMKLTDLFQKKNWDVSAGTAGEMSLFYKFCERLKLFSEEEQNMVVDLSDDFIRIGLQDYIEKLNDSLSLLGEDFFTRNQTIYVLPLVDPYIKAYKKGKTPRSKSKSAEFLHYLFDTSDWTSVSKKFALNITIKKLKAVFDPLTSCIVLIDDFVGSGETADRICKVFLEDNFSNGILLPENLKVVSIAAQENGIEYLKAESGVEAVSNILLKRGISDKFTAGDLLIKTDHMKQIERKLAVQADYLFGFKKSEAMITFLNKTPNNTFPVYWHETKTRVAPFPRYKKYDI